MIVMDRLYINCFSGFGRSAAVHEDYDRKARYNGIDRYQDPH